MNSRYVKYAVPAGIFFSAAAGLACELIWLRLFMLLYGASVTAVALVTAAFMAGLAIGSLLFARLVSPRNTRPLLVFGLIELGISMVTLGCFFLLRLTIGAGPGFGLTGLLALLSLILPAACMGMAFPAAADALSAGREGRAHRRLALLYAFETAGAAAGVLLTAFVLLGALGLTGTIFLCAGINLLIAIACLLQRGFRREPMTSQAKKNPFSPVVLLAAAQGSLVLIYEIAWTRVLALYMRNNTHGFALVLAGILIGLLLGSALAALLLRPGNSERIFWISHIALAATAVLFLPLTRFAGRLVGAFDKPGIGMALTGILFTALPAACAGLAFSALLARGDAEQGSRETGRIYGFNTAGAIAGSLAAGFLMIPWMGAANTIFMTALVNLNLMSFCLKKEKRAMIAIPMSGVLVIIILGFLSHNAAPPAVENLIRDGGKLHFKRESHAGTVTVAEAKVPAGLKICFVDNSSVISNIYDNLKTVGLLGHLPFVLKPDAQRCLVIGFGTGVTAGAALTHPVKEVVCAEICRAVIEASPFFKELNRGVLNDPRLDLRIDDGRNVLRRAEGLFDAVICDPVHPRLGSNALYTREFYQEVFDHLEDGGVCVQYLPFHDMPPDIFRMQVRTFQSVFPHASLWFGASHGLLAGIKGEAAPVLDTALPWFSRGPEAADLKVWQIPNIDTLLAAFICGPEKLRAFAGEGPLNSDFHPRVEFAPADDFETETVNMTAAAELAESAAELFTINDTELKGIAALAAKSLPHKILARTLQTRGQLNHALIQLREAESYLPNDREIAIFRYELERAEPR
ncbi:fused MFS/spermidine synthase [Planctomycetota bacterium]